MSSILVAWRSWVSPDSPRSEMLSVTTGHGILPTEPCEAARHESLMEAVEDLRAKMGPIARIKDEADKKRAREEAAREYLPQWAAHVEKHLGEGPFVGGVQISVADLKLFVALGPFLRGTIDHVPPMVWTRAPSMGDGDLHRRHLSPAQKAEIAAEVASLFAVEARARRRGGPQEMRIASRWY